MKFNEIYDLIQKKAINLVTKADMEVVDFSIVKRDKVYVTLLLYYSKGLTLEHCAEINRELNQWLEEQDFFEGEYIVEVSSPGIDRPIKTDDDLRRNLGNTVELKLYAAQDGKKIYTGVLEGYDSSTIKVSVEGEGKEFQRKKIALMTQAILF